MILVDTTPLVALSSLRDALHSRVVRDLQRLLRARLFVSDAVLAEAVHLLPAAQARARLSELIAALPIGPIADDAPIASRLEAFAWLARYAEHRPDRADATLVIASARNPKARVWTYDSEFATTWRRPDGTRVPLAVR